MAEMENPDALAGATGPEMPCYAVAAGRSKVSEKRGKCHKGATVYRVIPDDGSDPFTLYAKGRNAWALDRLRKAGPKGCTPISEPGPRWSAYVHNLRKHGVPIETLREPHDGTYPGSHGRYVLRAQVVKGAGHE